MAVSKALHVVHLAITLIALALVLFAYERSVEPLYGSVPAGYYLSHVILATTTVALIAPIPVLPTAYLVFGILLCAAPTTTYRIAVLTGRHIIPAWGSTVTHLFVLVPIFYVGSSIHLNRQLVLAGPTILESVIKSQLFCWFPLLMARSYLPKSPFLQSCPDDILFLALGTFSLVSWRALVAFMYEYEACHSRSKTRTLTYNILLIIAGIVIYALRAPTLPHPLLEPYTHPAYPLRILSSVQSTTGLIVVGEALPPTAGQDITVIHSLRYLRASHSLLGGVWIGDKVATKDDAAPTVDEEGTPLGDSIYAAFVLQEAARLVNSTDIGKENKWENALIIGLGAGISASAFNQHNISTTIVEIDSAVYEAARKYFGLPDPGPRKVFLEDARGWVTRKRASLSSVNTEKLYDIVVHDCFSGGGVPKHIFTVEFWEDLKAIVSPEGVVAVNFAGRLGSNASRAILLTLQKIFVQCRAFHDSIERLTEEQYRHEYVNMVFFCTSSQRPLTFRTAGELDYLHSYLRQHVLSSLTEREVDTAHIKGYMPEGDAEKWILTDMNNPLGDWQEAEALEHWKVMRQVLPDVFWETF